MNDDDSICKKVCAKCIKEMITRISHNQRLKLFDIVVIWMKDKKLVHRRLAVQLCGVFVTVEKDSFEARLDDLLPLLTKQFYATDNFNDDNQPGRFVKILKQEDEVHDEKITDPERLKDHHLFQVLQLLLKISANCPAFLKDKKYQEFVDTFAGEYSDLNIVLKKINLGMLTVFISSRTQPVVTSASSLVGKTGRLAVARIYSCCPRR